MCNNLTSPYAAAARPGRLPRLLAVVGFTLVAMGFGSQAQAQRGFDATAGNFVLLTADNASTAQGPTFPSTEYDTNTATARPDFPGASLGSFRRNDGRLLIQGAEVNTFERTGVDSLKSANFFYRVYPITTYNGDPNTGGNGRFRQFDINQVSKVKTNGNTLRRFRDTNITTDDTPVLPVTPVPINVVNQTSRPGTYYLEIFFQASDTTVTNTTTVTASNDPAGTQTRMSSVSNPSSGVRTYTTTTTTNTGTQKTVTTRTVTTRFALNSPRYRATFTVTAPAAGAPQAQTIWLGGPNTGKPAVAAQPNAMPPVLAVPADTENQVFSSNWFDPANWNNGVPIPTVDALIPNYADNSNPNRAPNPQVVYPNILSNNTFDAPYGPAETRTLTMEGNGGSDRSIVRLRDGEIKIYGDFSNVADSWIQAANTTFTLAGGNQTFTGSANFKDFNVQGSGVKTLTGASATIDGDLTFSGGILATQTLSQGGIRVLLREFSRLVGEDETHYLRGIVETKEVALRGSTQDFGNIGIDLTFDAASGDPNTLVDAQGNQTAGGVRVTRTTGVSAPSLLGPRPSIRRFYGIQPDGQRGGNPLSARIGVRYRDEELVNVSAQGVTTTLDEPQLTVWRSDNGGSNYTNLGRNAPRGIDPTNNRVTLNGVTSFNTFTLGQNEMPLPVNLTYFTAHRDRSGAILNWGTATEKDNAGFEVQGSTDGREFRTLTLVAPTSANSAGPRSYSYTDATAKTGLRYYRLRQVDTDGMFTYTPVRVVNFGATNAEAFAGTSTVFPNPFRGTEQLVLSILADMPGTAVVRVTDALGREMSRQTTEVLAGASSLTLPSLAAQPAGVYLVRLTLPSGTTQTIKIQKQ